MAKGYVIVRAIVTNPTAWSEYAQKATAACQAYGGTYIVRGGRCEVAEGEARARNVVIEFPTFEDAVACYHSDAYQEIVGQAIYASDRIVVIVETET